MHFRTYLNAGIVTASLFVLAGCNTDSLLDAKHLEPIPYSTLSDMKSLGMAPEDPILIRIFKEEAELEIWKQKDNGSFGLMKTYNICAWSGKLGPKIKEGDRQSPEGFYSITPGLMNPNSDFYLSFNLGFPNKFDQAHGRTGSFLMVHGACSSRGCYAMTDEQISEIYAIAREAFEGGQKAFQVQALPFRMTADNLARHADSQHLDFWKMLKTGSDHFELTKKAPKVDVCEKRYVFDAEITGNGRFSPRGSCPAYEIPERLASAVQKKSTADDKAFDLALKRLKEQAETEKRWKAREKKLATFVNKLGGADAVDVKGSAQAEEAEGAASPKTVPAPVAKKEPAPKGSSLPGFSWLSGSD